MTNIKEIFKRAGSDPVTDWIISLSVFFLLLLLGICLNVFIYARLAGKTVTESGEADTKSIFDRFELDRIAGSLEERKAKAGDVPDVILSDPSE